MPARVARNLDYCVAGRDRNVLTAGGGGTDTANLRSRGRLATSAHIRGGNMSESNVKDLAALLETAAENDSLLDQALQRIKDEAEGQRMDFFKHGQFGSHNA